MDTARGLDTQVFGAHPQGWGFDAARLGSFLRHRHGGDAVKLTARTIHAPVKTVEKWFQGQTPSLAWFLALIGAYGPDLLDACCERPPAWISAAAVEQRREALQRRMAALQDELRAMG